MIITSPCPVDKPKIKVLSPPIVSSHTNVVDMVCKIECGTRN